MKSVEKEAFVKSFLIFFILQTILAGALFFIDYQKKLYILDEKIFSDMRVCNFDLKCENYKLDFELLENRELLKLYKNNKEIASYFPIPGASRDILKIYLPINIYNTKIEDIQYFMIINFLIVDIILVFLSILFSIYTLYPLRNALNLTDEFVKDILHDFNTPLSTLRLNISMLKKQIGENKKIKRIENSVQNILNLQSNLRIYLGNNKIQNEKFSLLKLINEKNILVEKVFNNISFTVNIKNIELYTNKDSFSRIIDNILSNSVKYNKQNGKVTIVLKENILIIEDSGIGIDKPNKVFERFYKENDRGTGIGLHIVKKLCDELEIDITLKSELNVGTTFYLNLKNLLYFN